MSALPLTQDQLTIYQMEFDHFAEDSFMPVQKLKEAMSHLNKFPSDDDLSEIIYKVDLQALGKLNFEQFCQTILIPFKNNFPESTNGEDLLT